MKAGFRNPTPSDRTVDVNSPGMNPRNLSKPLSDGIIPHASRFVLSDNTFPEAPGFTIAVGTVREEVLGSGPKDCADRPEGENDRENRANGP